MLKKYKRVLNFKKAICSAKFIIFTISFLFYCNYSTFAEVDSILTEKELYEIAETVSFFYFQQFELQDLNDIISMDVIISKGNNSLIKDNVLEIYRNLLFKDAKNYSYKIDTFNCPITNKKGIKLFKIYYLNKKNGDYEYTFSQYFKLAIDKYGKCYKLYGFGSKTDDFEELFCEYFLDLESKDEVLDLLKFYINNVVCDITQSEYTIIDSVNEKKFKEYYPEISKPIITKENGLWKAKIQILSYTTSYGKACLFEFQFRLNEKERKLLFNDKIIKKYKNIYEE
ncbi:MAG TPA: hypothetical protein PK762_10130 [Candidatus Kapabacteria bacterium]|nr:hypothetical protein [Candidatus Kapabacteria bacterium]